MTIRAYFAGLAMQGILSSTTSVITLNDGESHVAEGAVAYADALIEKLNLEAGK